MIGGGCVQINMEVSNKWVQFRRLPKNPAHLQTVLLIRLLWIIDLVSIPQVPWRPRRHHGIGPSYSARHWLTLILRRLGAQRLSGRGPWTWIQPVRLGNVTHCRSKRFRKQIHTLTHSHSSLPVVACKKTTLPRLTWLESPSVPELSCTRSRSPL